MSITFTKAYQANGRTFATLEDAQAAALAQLFVGERATGTPWDIEDVVRTLTEKKDEVVNILTTTASSRPKGRKINGAARKTKKGSNEAQTTGTSSQS